MRVLNTSPRKYTVTGIDNHEIPGLDIVHIVNLIMNEYAYYGRGHSIHSSGQIAWYTNTVDDKSVQVRGQQRIVTIDGYSMPFVCKGGLMYLKLLGIPTDKDLQTCPSVHLTIVLMNGIHLYLTMYTQRIMESLIGLNDPTKKFQFDPNFDEFVEYVNRSLSITPQISSTHNHIG